MPPPLVLLCIPLGLIATVLLLWRVQRWILWRRTPHICAHCRHFDLEEGQAVIARFPSFMKAAAALPPQQMGRKILRYDKHACDVCEAVADVDNPGDFVPSPTTAACHVCRGNGYIEQPVFEPTNLPAKTRWQDFGACSVKETVLWSGDTCEQFQLVQLRAK